MTNEELVVLIQQGERDKLPELWAQVERFIWQQANRRSFALEGYGGVTEEDLHQAGFLALVKAVGSYDPAGGMSFIGWLALYLKTAFAEAAGYQGRKQMRDPLHRAHSLNAPLRDDPDAGGLEDILEDPVGLQEVEEHVDKLYLHAALEKALATLPEAERAVLLSRYYQGRTLREVGRERGISFERVRKIEAAGLRRLRHPRVLQELQQFR